MNMHWWIQRSTLTSVRSYSRSCLSSSSKFSSMRAMMRRRNLTVLSSSSPSSWASICLDYQARKLWSSTSLTFMSSLIYSTYTPSYTLREVQLPFSPVLRPNPMRSVQTTAGKITGHKTHSVPDLQATLNTAPSPAHKKSIIMKMENTSKKTRMETEIIKSPTHMIKMEMDSPKSKRKEPINLKSHKISDPHQPSLIRRRKVKCCMMSSSKLS